jgi:DNA polymerase II small subunit/DNA polymerase delta subunit B
MIEQFLENRYVFAPSFIFYSEFHRNVNEFLVFLQNHKRNPIVITNIYWFDFLNSKYSTSDELDKFLGNFFIEFALLNRILLNSEGLSKVTNSILNSLKKNQKKYWKNNNFDDLLISLMKKMNILEIKGLKAPVDEDVLEIEISETSYSKIISPNKMISFELPSLFPTNKGQYFDFLQYYNSRFQQLSSIIKKTLDQEYKDILFNEMNQYELQKQYLFIIFIEQVNVIQAKKSKVKTLDQEVQIHGVNQSFQHQFIITIGIDELKPIDYQTFPTGIVCGFLGEIVSEKSLDHSNIFHINASKILLPSIEDKDQNQKKNLSNDHIVAQTGKDNYALVIGSLNIDRLSESNYNRLIQWFSNPPINYRLKYVFFVGGILSFHPFQIFYRNLDRNNKSALEIYQNFFTDISHLPESIDFFFLPGFNDFTRKYIPQPPLAPKFIIKQKNMHYLSNPAKITIENQKIIFLNPSKNFWLYSSPYKDSGYKILFEMLQFRHLNPNWEQPIKSVPDSRDFLVIENIPKVIIASHPNSTQIPLFRNILAGTISSFNQIDNSRSESNNGIGILFNVKDPSKREIINLFK